MYQTQLFLSEDCSPPFSLESRFQPPSRTLLPAVIPFSCHARQSLLSPPPSLLPPALICTTSSPHPVLLPPFSHTTSCIHPEQEVVWLDHDRVDSIQLLTILLPPTPLISRSLNLNSLDLPTLNWMISKFVEQLVLSCRPLGCLSLCLLPSSGRSSSGRNDLDV
uniref:Uncharacterized protein n=1 Tax=Timema tahoe TaxID=61484 RepID=A0A7R9FIV6_9NEOP|nr:unnamed protein product [Timema tahoe]